MPTDGLFTAHPMQPGEAAFFEIGVAALVGLLMPIFSKSRTADDAWKAAASGMMIVIATLVAVMAMVFL